VTPSQQHARHCRTVAQRRRRRGRRAGGRHCRDGGGCSRPAPRLHIISRMALLAARVDALLSGLAALQTRVEALSASQRQRCASSRNDSAAATTGNQQTVDAHDGASAWEVPHDLNGQDNALQQRLRALCHDLSLRSSAFRRTPLDYYDWPLETRQKYLGAPSAHYLCKSIIVANTHCPHERFDSIVDSKYILLVVQYTAKLDFDRVARLVMRLVAAEAGSAAAAANANASASATARKNFNFRLAPEAASDALSGYSHNSVTPLGMRHRLPIVLSDRVAALPFVWLGGGEIDVKWRVATSEFVRAFAPVIANITEDAGDGAESSDVE
jgi:prolyl-tRNA editing enzyme YbaK/EbsC (Cys-tRNA(Pro) deacylase)